MSKIQDVDMIAKAYIADLERQLAEAQGKMEAMREWSEAVLLELEKAGAKGPAVAGVEHLRLERDEARAESKRLKKERVRVRTKEGMVAGSFTASVHTLQEQLEQAQAKLEAVQEWSDKWGDDTTHEGKTALDALWAILGEKGA